MFYGVRFGVLCVCVILIGSLFFVVVFVSVHRHGWSAVSFGCLVRDCLVLLLLFAAAVRVFIRRMSGGAS